MNILSIIKELRSEGSTKFKQSVLERESGNELLKRFFVACLDDSINYYVRKIPQYSKEHTGVFSLEEAMDELSRLSDRQVTGNAAKLLLSNILTQCSAEDAEAIKLIIGRDPDCKVSVGLVNKTWPGLVPVWPCMLCERSTRKNLDGLAYPALVQEKSDGLRMNLIYRPGMEIEARGRSGKFIQLHGVLDEQVMEIAKRVPPMYRHRGFVIDGEGLIIKRQSFNMPSKYWSGMKDQDLFEDRKTGNGIFNKAIKNTITDLEASLVRMKVWDIIPYDHFAAGRGDVPYKTRITIVKKILEGTADTVTKFGLTLTKLVKSEREALEFYKEMLRRKKEGAVIKDLEQVWEDDRSKGQVKLKVVKQIEMRCVGTYPHKKKKDWIGGLNLESEDGVVKVNSGSGMKDPDRKKPAQHYVGAVVMIESNGIIDSKDNHDGEYSLYLPIFKEVRLDKDVADTYDDIVKIFESI